MRFFNGNVEGVEKDQIKLKDLDVDKIYEVMLDEVTIKSSIDNKFNISIKAEESQFKTLYFKWGKIWRDLIIFWMMKKIYIIWKEIRKRVLSREEEAKVY